MSQFENSRRSLRRSSLPTEPRPTGPPTESVSRSPEHAFFAESRSIIADLFVPRPLIYWADMTVTSTIAYASALVFMTAPALLGWRSLIALLTAGFALFRAGSFIHEIQHFNRGQMRAFSAAWNIGCGILMLSPSYMYDNHQGHHRHDTYGTLADGEYLPLGRGSLRYFAIYVGQALLIPLLVGVRFLILVPLSFCYAPLRRWLLERFSYFGINPHYCRKLPPDGGKTWWAVIDAVCSVRIWIAFAVVGSGLAPWTHIPKLYVLGVLGLGLNYIRNLTAHRYRNDGRRLTYFEQLADSINIIGHPLWTELWYPVGLRYHALHHLFPAIPYHNLGKAHRRLMQRLPADSPYRATVYPGFFTALSDLWRGSVSGQIQHASVERDTSFALAE